MTKYRTDASAWPDPRRPRRPVPSMEERLREMQADADRNEYGPNDRQSLMLSLDEITELLGLLEFQRKMGQIDTLAGSRDRDDRLNAVRELAGAVHALGWVHVSVELEIVQ